MGIKYGRGWGGARISLSRGSVLSREYFPSSVLVFFATNALFRDWFWFESLRINTRSYRSPTLEHSGLFDISVCLERRMQINIRRPTRKVSYVLRTYVSTLTLNNHYN